jgi:hypothetical protein
MSGCCLCSSHARGLMLQENFRDDLSKDDWRLVVKLKGVFNIQ